MLRTLILIASILSVGQVAAAQNFRDVARERAATNPGVPITQPAPPLLLPPKPIEAIATEADVIVQARLSAIGSRLSAESDHVQTDYAIVEPIVIGGQLAAGNTHTQGQTLPPILEIRGGEVVIDGVTIRTTDQNREAIVDGGRYLLFLKQSRPSEPGRYIVYYGGMFDIGQANVRPLFTRGHEVYRDAVGGAVSDFETRIRSARQAR